MSSTAAEGPSAIRLILASPLLRGAVMAQFLSGVGVAAAAPQIATFLVDDLGASLTIAGLYYLTSLLAPLVGFGVGALSDRTGGRLGLFRWCACLGSIGWLGIATAQAIWVPFVMSAVFLGFASAAASQLFAAVHDELALRPGPANEDVVAIVRMALTAGWVVGPTVGALIAASAGQRPLLFVTAFCTLAQVVPLGRRRDSPARGVGQIADRRPPTRRELVPLLVFAAMFILIYSGEPARYAYLPIHMRDNLQLSPALVGAVIGTQPLVQLPLMLFIVGLGARLGWFRALAAGAGLGVGAYLLFAFSPSVIGLFAGQVLMGTLWATLATIGLIVSQRLLPTAVATATAIFLSAQPLAQGLGGLTIGVAAGIVGLPLAFLVPAALCLVGSLGLYLMGRRVRV